MPTLPTLLILLTSLTLLFMPPVTLDTPFGFSIDLSFWQWFFSLSSIGQAKALFALGAWTILSYVVFKAGAELWVEYREKTKYMAKWQWVVLAVDVPALFIQTPKAVEQVFANLSGSLGSRNVVEKFWQGKKQKWFSFEIVSIEGYIQFLIRTEAEYRDLVEASIYAQYTDAEITEVEDYVENVPSKYPNDEYDVFGVEFKLAEKDAYPIRTYPDFEYKISIDVVFSDPMAATLENFTRIGHGENLWMQLMIEPTGSSWKEEGINLAKELMGHEVKKKGSTFLSALVSFPAAVLKELVTALQAGGGEEGGAEAREAKKELTPGVKSTVEAIEEKIAKIGFKSKLRVLYAARKEVYNPSRCVDGFIGAMNQFHVQSRNALVPYMITLARYDQSGKKTKKLKNTFVKVFKARKTRWKKSNGYILNIEELATIWHFPLPFVKTPLLSKSGYKRSEPPFSLPVEVTESPLKKMGMDGGETQNSEPAPPENLPYG